MSAPRTTWRATEPEAAARRVAGRPAQAFWPLLAPSFRWVLLPPHRRAGVDVIEWEWRASPTPAKPGASDLNDLRARLRDSLDLLATDLRRRPALPDGLAAAALLDEFEQIFGALRHSPDKVLAEHAVLTDLGWMLRSWGVSRPSPARPDEPAPAATRPSAAPKPATLSEGGSETSRRKRRLLPWSLLAVTIAAAAGWRYLTLETSPTDTAAAQANSTPADASKKPDSFVEPSAEPPPPKADGTEAQKTTPAQTASNTLPADATPLAPAGSPPAAAAVTPAALTGEIAATPDALAPQAGPPSDSQGAKETPPGFAARRSDSSPDAALSALPAGAPGARPPDEGAETSSANEGPSTASTANTALAPEMTDRSSTPEAAPRPPPEPDGFTVEARAAPAPNPPPSPLPGRAGETRAATPRETTEAELSAPETASGEERRTSAIADAAMPPRADDAMATQAGGAPSWDEPARRLLLRVAPWRVVLERDIVLPSRPFEGTGEAELRAARIAAWAQARALTPPAFRRKELLAGWTFTFEPNAAGQGTPVWRIQRGKPSVQELDPVAGRARIGWPDADSGEMEAWLTDASGAPLARLWRKPNENRIQVFVAPTVSEIRPWFALRLRPADSGEGLDAPEGWNLENAKRQLLAEGPEGATRMRWTHPESGWVLHGGYTRETP